MMSELRKYGVGLVLAHQYFHQLETDVRHAVLGNAGTLISFRVGPEDAAILEREFQPVFGCEDLLNLPNRSLSFEIDDRRDAKQSVQCEHLEPHGEKSRLARCPRQRRNIRDPQESLCGSGDTQETANEAPKGIAVLVTTAQRRACAKKKRRIAPPLFISDADYSAAMRSGTVSVFGSCVTAKGI